jgi:hypothetical protein
MARTPYKRRAGEGINLSAGKVENWVAKFDDLEVTELPQPRWRRVLGQAGKAGPAALRTVLDAADPGGGAGRG